MAAQGGEPSFSETAIKQQGVKRSSRTAALSALWTELEDQASSQQQQPPAKQPKSDTARQTQERVIALRTVLTRILSGMHDVYVLIYAAERPATFSKVLLNYAWNVCNGGHDAPAYRNMYFLAAAVCAVATEIQTSRCPHFCVPRSAYIHITPAYLIRQFKAVDVEVGAKESFEKFEERHERQLDLVEDMNARRPAAVVAAAVARTLVTELKVAAVATVRTEATGTYDIRAVERVRSRTYRPGDITAEPTFHAIFPAMLASFIHCWKTLGVLDDAKQEDVDADAKTPDLTSDNEQEEEKKKEKEEEEVRDKKEKAKTQLEEEEETLRVMAAAAAAPSKPLVQAAPLSPAPLRGPRTRPSRLQMMETEEEDKDEFVDEQQTEIHFEKPDSDVQPFPSSTAAAAAPPSVSLRGPLTPKQQLVAEMQVAQASTAATEQSLLTYATEAIADHRVSTTKAAAATTNDDFWRNTIAQDSGYGY